MNIIVLTSAMIDDEFNQYVSITKIKPNPSNQNFYSKLIKSLSYKNNVSVLSLRPFVKGSLMETFLESRMSVDGMVHYYYPYMEVGKIFKMFKQEDEILETFDQIVNEQHYESFVVIVDILRRSLLNAALKIKKKYQMPIIAVLTDNASNLTGAKRSYVTSLRYKASKFDGYLALSGDLNRIYNSQGKPNYIFEGLVDDVETMPRLTIQDYFFFGGALYERYGVKHLIDAFHKSTSKYKLVIAGHGDLENYIETISKKDQRILFLNQVDKKTMYGLEQNAIANINPRPFSTRLDKESVPSKLLEYFASGAPTITTMHTRLHEIFSDNAIWLINDNENGIAKAIDSFDDYDYKELKKGASSARLKVYELYSLKNQGEAITYFLTDLVNSSSRE